MSNKNIETIAPLSSVQEGLLYETICAPESGIHIEQSMYTLTGPLDVAALRQAWQWAVQRHAILRTGFVWKQQNNPLQITLHHAPLSFEVQDWRKLSSEQQRAQAEDYLRQERTRGFDLVHPPLMRLTLLQLDEQIHCLLWTFHTIILDGWSRQTLLNEVSACYLSLSQGQAAPGGTCRPYRDYIAWLQRQDVKQAEQFWRSSLRGFRQPTALGRQQEREPVQKPQKLSEMVQGRLSEEESVALHTVASQHHITLSTLLQGIWTLLLSHYSRSRDVVFGVTVSGRPAGLVGVETIMGLCINTLPLRVQLPEHGSIWTWLEGLQRYNMELQASAYVSAGQVHQWSEMVGSSPLYESLLVAENYPAGVGTAREESGIGVGDAVYHEAQTRYPLTLLIADGVRLSIRCIYDTRRFERGSVELILQQFQRLVSAVVTEEYEQIGELERLIAQEPLPLVYTTPRQTYLKREGGYQIQRGPLEELVESVWKEAFGLEHISRECNFFALGGHSLLATQVMSRMRQILQREIPLRVLFEHPTIATLSSQLEILRQGETHFSAPTLSPTLSPTLLPMERSQEIPLSFAQERLWFLNQLEPLNYANHFPTAVHLRGQISVMALERALQQLIERHESLRTTFVSQQGRPVQVIAPVLSLPLYIINVEASGEAARDELMRTFFHLPFDLAHGPLVRLYLLRLEEQVHVLLVNMHHIVTDDRSIGILVRELSTLYQAQVQASPGMLPALPIQYADYALWQRRWLQGEVLEDQLTYWKQQLADAPTLLELPTDHHRPKTQTFAGSLQKRLFPLELLQQLQQLSQQEGVTLFMTLLAAFQVLLMRYSGQADIVVGSPITNRTPAETEGLIGCFANTLVLRCDLSGQPSFRALLARVREVTLQAYEHQEVPFEQVVEALQVEHSLSHSPLFQVLFVLQNTPEVSMNGAGLTWNSVEIEQATTRFDLSLHLREGAQGLYVGLEYNTALFEASSIARMLDHWQKLVICIVQRPAQRITEIPLLTSNEREQILVQWNQTASLSEAPLWLHERFEQQVTHTPDAIAVVFEQQHLSYYLLDKQANRLARTLQKRGVGPDALVGICLERSAELVVAVLAVLKAGGAYVPFDPTAPAQRLTALIADAGVRLVLTEPAILPLFTDHAIPALLVPSAEEEGALDTETEKITSQIQGEHLAYMIYTSGSTGKPKGAMNTHRGISNRLAWMQQTYSLTALDRVVQKTPMTFDVSVWEMLWPLLSGAVLVVAEPGGHQDPHYLKELVQQQGISTMHFVPSILQAFLEEPELRSACKSLRQVMCSGEAFTPELQARFFARLPEHVRLHNLYGPTEAAIGITSWSCSPGERSVPIGRPIANTQIYVLDERGQPVPVGVRGELYIGGVSLARGYHGRPDLTGERFVPDPYGPNLGSRLYRTGDLVRYRADGAIEYLGRLDHQVKLRGMRIEPGEIEAVLRAHPAILEAVVLAREERPGDMHLVAYLVGRQGQRPAPGEVRAYLQEHLPPPMIPSALVFLDALPLMPNGKLDRRALPAPEPNSSHDEMVGPSTPLEEVTLLIWADLLHLAPSQISVHDNFFALGGHSLLATQVTSRLRQVLQVEVPLRTLFEAPTIAELTQRIDAQRYGSRQEAIPALVPVNAAEIELSFAQERLWFLYQLESHSSFYNMPFVLHPVGRLSIQALEQSLATVVQRHEILRTTFVMRQDQPVQMIAPALTLPLPVIDLSGLDSTEQKHQVYFLLQQEERYPFDLATGPLLRSCLLRLDTQDHVLLFMMHHIISDGWSMGVLTRELLVLYQASLNNEPSPLPALAIQYADYAHWQRQWLQGEVFQRQLDYWLEQLKDAPELLNLPTDRPRPAVQSYAGSREVLVLSPHLSQALMKLSQREGVTLYMTLLTAYQILLMHYSGQSDILVGTPIANRTRGELEPLIGFFVNTLVMRTDLSGNPSFRQALARVREVALDAFAHQDLPFEKLVDALQIERSASYAPLFQVLFVLQNAPNTAISLPDLTFLPTTLEHTTAHFDLAFDMWMTEEGLRTSVEYVSALFDVATIQRLLGHWQVLLEGIVAHSEQPIGFLPLLTGEEQARLIRERNETTRIYPREATVTRLFDEQVARTPDAIALVWNDQQISYGELDRRANQVAGYLCRQGVRSGMLVGIVMGRTIEMLVSLLGVLKASAGYLPLDPDHPVKRLKMVLEDAGVALTLTQKEYRERLASYAGPLVVWEEVKEEIQQQPRSNLVHQERPDDLIYVMYTSGSTGKPKGVCIPHRAVLRLVQNTNYMHFSPEDRIVHAANVAFDASTFELWGPWLNGGCVILVQKEELLSSTTFASILKEQSPSSMFFTTALLNQLANHQPEIFTTIDTVLFGGEAVDVHSVRNILKHAAPRRLLHVYGPTECTTYATWYEIQELEEQAVTIPIGQPLANTELYILNDWMQPVPEGIPGELYIGGDGLAHGYLDCPEPTAERFVPHPFSNRAGARLYRTGDIVKWRGDGNVVFIGRRDHQIKLRGHRIELGEIETALLEHPAVQESVALLREDTPGDQHLTVYVVPTRDQQEIARAASSWAEEQIESWLELYEDMYRSAGAQEDPTFNIFGWNSSYTGLPIPAEEMREQIEQAVERILERGPERVMEIGFGSGLLLFRIAPHCQEYVASDFSREALDYVQQVLATHPCPQVTLTQQQALESLQVPAESFDTIILNSVLQYFPDIEYVVRVLMDALAALKPGGFLFLGDVRNLALQKAYSTSVELYKAQASLTREALRQAVLQRLGEEEELLIDPAFFLALQREWPQIGQVQVLLKRGRTHNELTQFRYDVVLRKAATEEIEQERIIWNWQQGDVTLDRIERFLQAGAPEALQIEQVPNTRLAKELQQVLWVFGEQGPATVKELYEELEGQEEVHGPTPEDFWAAGERLGYRVTINWSAEGDGSHYDVLFSQAKEIQVREYNARPLPKRGAVQRWFKYANNPLQGKMARTLIPQLRSFLKTQLAEYALPSHYVILESLPLTPNGKVDRRALPIPDRGLSATRETFVAPHTEQQERLATIWIELLHISQISIHDNFFELGGHSLLATQVISRLRNTFQIDLPLRSLFEHPTIAQLALIIEQQQQMGLSLQRPALIAQERPAVLPLSFAQERLWFLDQLEPLSSRYNMPAALQFSGFLSIMALEKSVKHIVQRHEVLRTTFAFSTGRPVQVIAPELALPLPVFDLSGLSADEREGELRHLLAQEANRPFDLERGPLLRVAVMHLGVREHVFLFNQHHIVSDGWSLSILAQELRTFYQAYRTGQVPELAALRLQYADYALWQRQWLQGEVLQEQLDYWRQQLANAPTVLNLPIDRARPAIQTVAGASISRLLPAELLRSLKNMSQQKGATLFMALLATLGILLQRYSGQDDIVVGSPIANRSQAEVEALIGFFVNTLALRIDLSSDPSFNELLERVREVTLQAYTHQDIPFEKLVEELKPTRSLSYNPLFQVLFALQNVPEISLKMGAELSAQAIDSAQPTTIFDLSLLLQERIQGLHVFVKYNTDLFDSATIARLLDHWEVLLRAIVEQPEQAISRFPLMTPEEQQGLLAESVSPGEWNTELYLHTYFEQQVEKTPEAIALVFDDQHLTYRALDQHANRLAHWLQIQGVGPDTLVGVYMERSVEMPIALLGVLKAGGAFLPLDPHYPQERIGWIVQQAAPVLILTQNHLAHNDFGTSCRLFCLDSGWGNWTRETSERLARKIWPSQLAYVLYTSGSTGRPKGVAIEHRSVSVFLSWVRQTFTQEEIAGVIASTSISFDISIFELFAPLSCGGMVILTENVLRIPELPACGRATLLNTVPSAATELLQIKALPASLRTINLAGEALSGQLVRQLYRNTDVQKVYNLYGPTEDTIYSTSALIARNDTSEPPIGRPLANTQALILDEELRLVPVGVVGELYLGGAGLARGYLQRGDLTAELFVPHPWSQEVGARLYRTGDQARYRADGSIEYLGRVDQQVKLRGFRIELAEIEAALLSQRSVNSAAVVLQEDSGAGKSLIAYLVVDAELPISAGELRTYLREHVPEYMIPAHFVMLEQLPRTPNGKVDRRTLAQMPILQKQEREDMVAPRNPDEYELAMIWRELLNLEQVSVHDNFFEIGGHSLLAVRLLHAIHQRFGATFPLAVIFQYPTVAQEAALVSQEPLSPMSNTSLIVPLRKHGSRLPFFMVHPVSGDLYSYLALARHLPQERPIYGIQARGLLDGQEPVVGIEEMADLYVEALLTLQPEGPYLLGGHSLGGLIALEMAHRLQAQGHVVSLLVLIDSVFSLEEISSSNTFDETQWQLEFAKMLEHYRGQPEETPAVSHREFQRMNAEEQVHSLLELAKAARFVSQETDRDAFVRLLRVVRANAKSQHDYRPRKVYQGNVVLLTCEEKSYDPWSLWQPWITGLLEMQTVSGNHFSLLIEPHVSALAEHIQGYLDQHSQ